MQTFGLPEPAPSPVPEEAFAALTIREVRPDDDAPALDALLSGLDVTSRYTRWFTGAADVHKAATWAAHPDPGAVGLVAVAEDGTIVGHAVLVPATKDTAEVAFEVDAQWRHHGIAGHLLDALAAAGRERGLRALTAEVLAINHDMLAVFQEHGADCRPARDGITFVELALAG